MALIEMDFAGSSGGGSLTRVELWRNNNPSADMSSTSVTLSQDMDNFDYLEFVYALSKSNLSTEYTMMVPVDVVKMTSISANKVQIVLCASNNTPSYFARRIGYTSNTKLSMGDVKQIGGTVTSNGYAMPLRINGVNIS